jgi:hypothetical protein
LGHAYGDVRLVKRRREAKHVYYTLCDRHVLRVRRRTCPVGQNARLKSVARISTVQIAATKPYRTATMSITW